MPLVIWQWQVKLSVTQALEGEGEVYSPSSLAEVW